MFQKTKWVFAVCAGLGLLGGCSAVSTTTMVGTQYLSPEQELESQSFTCETGRKIAVEHFPWNGGETVGIECDGKQQQASDGTSSYFIPGSVKRVEKSGSMATIYFIRSK